MITKELIHDLVTHPERLEYSDNVHGYNFTLLEADAVSIELMEYAESIGAWIEPTSCKACFLLCVPYFQDGLDDEVTEKLEDDFNDWFGPNDLDLDE